MTFRVPHLVAILALAASLRATGLAAPTTQDDVLKATLANGLRVIVVRNTLAPVVSTDRRTSKEWRTRKST
jgi:zinc protease